MNHGNYTSSVWREGDKFWKKADGTGSPHAEAAASKGFDLLGVPHVPTGKHISPENPWLAHNFSTFHENLKPIQQITQSELRHAMKNPQHTSNTLLAEWLMHIDDRHGGNYAIMKPGSLPVSIDHGQAFARANSGWASELGRGLPLSPHRRALVGSHFSLPHNKSALYGLHVMTESPFAPTSKEVVDRALAHPNEFAQLAHEGTEGLPPDERSVAEALMNLRLKVLREHIGRIGHLTGGKLMPAEFPILHAKTMAEAKKAFRVK